MEDTALDLFDKTLNTDLTAKNVRKFFDTKFQKYLNFSGKHRTDLSSPLLDPTGVSSHGVNHQENKEIISTDAGNCVKAINDAIIDCSNSGSKPYASILYYCYIEELFDWQISQKLGYSKTRYLKLKKEALIEFAERLEYWKKQDKATDIKRLLVFYEDNK